MSALAYPLQPVTSLDCDGLREVSRLIDVGPLEVGHVVGEQLHREHREQRQDLALRLGHLDDAPASRAAPPPRRLCGAPSRQSFATSASPFVQIAMTWPSRARTSWRFEMVFS